MKGLIKNTPTNSAWIDANEYGFMQDSYIGESGIMDFKNKLQVTKVNDNTVRIASGVFMLNGKAIIEENYTDLTVDSGSIGLRRFDLVIAEYVQEGEEGGDDTLHFRILKGVSSNETPTKPLLNNTDTVEQEFICTLYIDGTTLHVQESSDKIIQPLTVLRNDTYSKEEIHNLLQKEMVMLTRLADTASIAANPTLRKHTGYNEVAQRIGNELIVQSGVTLPSSVTIGKGISKVVINAQLFNYTASEVSTGGTTLEIFKNGISYKPLANNDSSSGRHRANYIVNGVMSVSEGDVIELYWSNTNVAVIARADLGWWSVEKIM